MSIMFSPTDTYSMYGDSISDFISFNTFNQALYRDIAGKIRFSENLELIADGSITNGRPGWDLAIAGTSVTAITNRFVNLVARDEAKVVFVLMGANNYGAEGPGTGSPQDWMDRADEIVAAASAAGKILVFIPPISHHRDPVAGRDVLKEYLPTLASDTVIVPDTSAFDWRVGTNDGVHPNAAGAELLAQQVFEALAPRLPTGYDFTVKDNRAINLVANGDLAGSGGVLLGEAQGHTQGVVADGWTLRRVGATGTVIADKALDAAGQEVQVIRYDGDGEVRLTQGITLSGHAGEQYEVVVKISVSDPNGLFQGFRAWDSDKANGILFAPTSNPVLASGGTGSYQTTLRSAKFTLTSNEQQATVNLSAYFGNQSGAAITIEDVIVRRVADTPQLVNHVFIGTDAVDNLVADDLGQTLQGFAGNDTLIGGFGDDILDGGTDRDTMHGGGGNDLYIVDNAGDQIFETVTKLVTDVYDMGGIDQVQSSVSYSIASSIAGRQFIENLTLTGPAAINATGNNLANTIVGNAAKNVLTGNGGNDFLFGKEGNDRLVGGDGDDLLVGGAGADVKVGGNGIDTFRFDVLSPPTERDSITDFVANVDVLELGREAFTAFSEFAAAALDPLHFATGIAATTSDHHLIYNLQNGVLSYDSDGAGGAAAVAIAQFVNRPTITASDIFLI